jgi:hypothetical protein
MSEKVDWREVLAASAKRLRAGVEGPRNADLLDKVGEDVAELIDADKEYDAAVTALMALNRQITEQGWLEVEHDALREASTRLVRARMRRWDALARIAGIEQ